MGRTGNRSNEADLHNTEEALPDRVDLFLIYFVFNISLTASRKRINPDLRVLMKIIYYSIVEHCVFSSDLQLEVMKEHPESVETCALAKIRCLFN